MAGDNGRITNDRIYDLVNSVRLELKADINRLESKFDALESGRLTNAEKNINELKVGAATQTTKLAILGFIAASVIGAIISVLVTKALK